MALSDHFSFRSIRSVWRGARQYLFGKPRRSLIRGLQVLYRIRMLMILTAGKRLPFPRSTHVRLWVDREVFPRIRALIGQARHTVVVQMFIWMDDELGRGMARLLTEVADRGVRVYVSKEAVGDFFELDGDFLTTKNDRHEVWKRFWNHPNIRVSHTVHHDHAKVYIIDDHIMLLTGMNIAQEYHDRWHDYMVELRGTEFVQHYLSRGNTPMNARNVRLVMNTDRCKEIRTTVRALLASAKKSIVLEQGYLSDPEVISTLIARSKEGIHVTAILPEQMDIHYYSTLNAVSKLISGGHKRHMRVFNYPGWIHGKIILVDHKRAFVGSANLITSSLDEMGEVNVLLEGKVSRAVQKLQDTLRRDVLKSRPMKTPPAFAWATRLLAWFSL